MGVAGAVHPGRAVGEKAGRKEVEGVSGTRARSEAHLEGTHGPLRRRSSHEEAIE